MRTVLLTAALICAPTAAFATCVPLPTTQDRVQNLANERALTLCEVQELHDTTARRAQQLQLQADLQALQNNLELEFKLQQTFNAASTPPTLPQF